MKKVIGSTLALGTYLLASLPAFAAGPTVIKPCDPNNPDFNRLCNLASGDAGTAVSKVIIFLLIAAVIIALIFLVYGGIKWILSGGDKSAVEGARNHIVAAIVGLIVAFAAYFIVNVVAQVFLGHPITGLTLPSF